MVLTWCIDGGAKLPPQRVNAMLSALGDRAYHFIKSVTGGPTGKTSPQSHFWWFMNELFPEARVAPDTADTDREILLVYDHECPACDAYCKLMRVSPSAGILRLINAREASAVMKEITDAHLDIDQGMVVKEGGRLHYGSDAIHVLALLSSRSGFFNRLNYWLFRSQTLSRVLYPALRACRNLLLKAMRKTKINNLRMEGNDRF